MFSSRFGVFVIWYVLVIFFVVFGLLRNDARFYILAVCNGLFLALCSFLSSYLDKKTAEHSSQSSTPSSPESHRHTHTTFVKMPSVRKTPLWVKRVVLGGLGIVVVGGFVYFFKNPILSLMTPTPNEFDVPDSAFTGKGEILEMSTGSTPVLEATGEVIGTSFVDTGKVSSLFVPSLDDEATGEVVTGIVDTQSTLLKDLGLSTGKSLTMMDAIVYLLKSNDIAPSSAKTVFAYVSKKNSYYGYWAAAYQKHLIGVSTSPSKLVMCETYFTLKGMLEHRNVQYTTATVKQVFWAEAKKRDILKGCVYGKAVKAENL